ncbi:Phosphatidylserine decarboxylase proenzyme [Microbulbifer aggregans]|uniref:Phosphatidylserine decarboxylase proenzyme n=1 Tax=Microbulbifer aggregans TaxID=1769779 RepID=A0A1C9W639_9GAMM|nr:archaetidylserine decarboxylase [Microbulbifer aggregans]AOS96631.1 Phosphatidylserine decarboxylase proenzyme [Microbulbifer aggregans]
MNPKLFAALQYLTPQHTLSRAAGWLAETRNTWIKDRFTGWFVDKYGVDMDEAQEPDYTAYANFNDFFTRALKDGARPIVDGEQALACPADGHVSQLGEIHNGRIFQAKGHDYSLLELVGGDPQVAAQFTGGTFATVYLSPRDYHRVHMPVDGVLRSMVHVPGQLFSVNQVTTEEVPRLFARNERVVCLFDTPAGPMAMVLVGAMIVASIETVWAGLVTPHKRRIRTTHYGDSKPIALNKGEEMGRFKLGSTVILLFGADRMKWLDSLGAESPVKMGEHLGDLQKDTN